MSFENEKVFNKIKEYFKDAEIEGDIIFFNGKQNEKHLRFFIKNEDKIKVFYCDGSQLLAEAFLTTEEEFNDIIEEIKNNNNFTDEFVENFAVLK